MNRYQEKRLLALVTQSNLSQEACKEALESCEWDVFKAYNLLSNKLANRLINRKNPNGDSVSSD